MARKPRTNNVLAPLNLPHILECYTLELRKGKPVTADHLFIFHDELPGSPIRTSKQVRKRAANAMYRLRIRLAPYGITIETVDTGYKMSASSRKLLAATVARLKHECH